MPRVTLTLILLLAPLGLTRAACTSPGKERWAIKSTLPTGAQLGHATTVKIGDLAKLANPPGVTNKEKKFEDTRIPTFDNPLHVKEGDLVTITGYLFLVATEDNDCEYHIELSAKAPDMSAASSKNPVMVDDCIIVEVARPDAFSDATLQKAADTTRQWIREKLKLSGQSGAEPAADGSLMSHPVFVTVTGQLFFDDAHLEKDGSSQPRGKHGLRTNTLWELHPIVAINFAKP